MPDNIKPLSSLFPLIDDPANIFYSKLKNIFLSYPTTFLHVKAVNRTERVVEIHFPFSTQVWKVKQDIRILPEEVASDMATLIISNYNAYVLVDFTKTHKKNTENTTSGEVIPVDEYVLSLNRVWPNLRFYKSKEKVIITEDSSNHISVGFKVGDRLKVQTGGLFDFFPVEKAGIKDEFKAIYKPIIGRRIHFHKVVSGVLTFWKWDLYDVDSNLEAHLIDSMTVDSSNPDPVNFNSIQDSQKSCGYNVVWPICYGPAIDHPVSLTFTKRVSNPETKDDIIIEILENAYVSDRGSFVDISMNPNTDFVLDNRGLLVNYQGYSLKDCLKDIRFYPRKRFTRVPTYYREEILLALCYIFNFNFRHLYEYILLGYPNSIRYFSGVFGNQYDPHKYIGQTTVTNGYQTLNIPDNLKFDNAEVVPLNQISNMYNSALPGFSMNAVIGNNTVALIQNSISYNDQNWSSPFDRFRVANLNYLKEFRKYFKENLGSGRIPNLSDASIYSYIKSLPNFTVDNMCLDNANLFSEVQDA